MNRPLIIVPVLAAVSATACQAPPASHDHAHEPTTETDIGVMVYVGDETVRDYRPRPALAVDETIVPAARYPAIDVHCQWTLDVDAHALLAAMDERNVRAAVNLSGGWGKKLERMLDRFHRVAPQRLLIFCNVDFSRIDEPGFGATMADELRRARAAGVSGLKIFKNLGLTIKDASGAVVAVDDPRLDPIWATCGELDMPVLIHSADPVAFFEPADRDNERWMQLKRHPDWSFHGDQFPSREAVLAQRDRMMKRHADTAFICAHIGSLAGDLDAAGRMLDEHPNAYVDISGRVGELGRQPYSARRFILDHQDRVLFGTDRYPGRPSQPRYRIYYRFLETDDEYFDYYDHPFPPAGDWRIYGVHLPDDVLRKVYQENAARLFGW
jgi:predicted TIM-barrel fold metal-dependent hydrolase